MNVTMSMEKYQEMKDKIRILEEKEKQLHDVVKNIEEVIETSNSILKLKADCPSDSPIVKYHSNRIDFCKSLVNINVKVFSVKRVNLLDKVGGLI